MNVSIENVLKKLDDLAGIAPKSEPNIPSTLKVTLPDADEDHQEYNHLPFDSFIGLAIGIHYVDAKGKKSERRIRIKTLHEQSDGDILMKCHCFERGSARSFKFSRVKQIIDLQTGEVFNPLQFFKETFELAPTIEKKDETKEALKQSRKALHIFVFVARCDGVYDEDEKALVLEYVEDSCSHLKFDSKKVIRFINSLDPDEDTFFDAVDYLKSTNDNEQKRILSYIRRIVDSDGVIEKSEFNLLLDIDNAIHNAT